MLLLESGHYGELKEALGAGLPAIFAAMSILSDLVAPRRRQVALVGLSICMGTAMGLAIVVWAL